MKNVAILSSCLFLLLFAFGCDSAKKISDQEIVDIPGKVMVLLDKSVKPKKLVGELSAYELKNEGQISRSEYRFSFSFNTSKISAEKLIEEINALSYASEATIPQLVKD